MRAFLVLCMMGEVIASASFMAAKQFSKRVAFSAAIMGTGTVASAVYFPPETFKQPPPVTDPLQLARVRNEQLIWAIRSEKDDEIMDLLIEGADPNFMDNNGRTFMNYALSMKVKPHLVTIAIMSGLDLDRYDVSMRGTFLDGAIFVQKYELANILFKAGCPNSVPAKDLINFIVRTEADLEVSEESQVHLLILALYRGNGRDKRVLYDAVSTAYWNRKYKFYEFLRSIEQTDLEWP